MADRFYSNTRAALAAYDRWNAAAWAAIRADLTLTNEDVYAWQAEVERQGRLVGYAFWLDTDDWNSRNTCEGCVRPGEPWLRALVAKNTPPEVADGPQAL